MEAELTQLVAKNIAVEEENRKLKITVETKENTAEMIDFDKAQLKKEIEVSRILMLEAQQDTGKVKAQLTQTIEELKANIR